MAKHKMTERQKRFAGNYLELGNVAQSAIKAGYSKKLAHTARQNNIKKRKRGQGMDNTNMIKDVAENPADKKSTESIAATSTTSTTSTTNLAPSANPQSAKPKSEAPAFAKADDACAAKEGDTLLTIANRHKVSLGLLKVLNGIDDALKQLDKDKLIKLK